MSLLPVDFTYWLEQGMDPTHANYLHHTCAHASTRALLPAGCRHPGLACRGVDAPAHPPLMGCR
jgi:hypothetical protein